MATESIGLPGQLLETVKQAAAKEEKDPTDDRILECAVDSRSEYLVTGDSFCR
jgi:predicted nucleic acid-binding protein